MPSTAKPTYAAHAITAISLLATVTTAHAHERSLLSHQGVRPRGLNTMTYVGCFSSSDGLTDQGSYQYQTSGYCQPICTKQNQAVLGLSGGSDCWCGDTFPEQSSKVDDSNCNTPCNGYGSQNCGGTNFWSVYTSGTEDESAISYADGSSTSSASSSASVPPPPPSSSTEAATTSTTTPASISAPAATTPSTTASPSVVTSIAPGHTVIITQPAAQATGGNVQATPTASSKGSSTNVAGVAAGVVVGVVAVAAIIGGLIYFLKRRRQQAVEHEYKRSTQIGDFMRGRGNGNEPKPPPTAYSNMSDSRLDPTAGRRNSAGSIADDQDYSRRILRVANPDNS